MITDSDINWSKKELQKLKKEDKFQTMFITASVVSKLLEKENLRPIVVGGFSLAIYINPEYTTRDIDMVVINRIEAINILIKLDFRIDGRYLVKDDLEIMIEFPDDFLIGSYDKVKTIEDDEPSKHSLCVISIEDILMDRVKRYIFWEEKEAKETVFKLLARYWREIDFDYLKIIGKGSETKEEPETISSWITEVEQLLK